MTATGAVEKVEKQSSPKIGASAFAATQLAKNSVGTKQLKNNAVTTAKIKNNAVTGAKIKNGTITGAKINLGSLGTVPSATNATNAANATNAGNAATVGGRNVKEIFSKLPPNTGPTVIFSAVGFNIVATCNASGNPEIELDPQTTENDTAAMGNGSPGGAFFVREQGIEPNSIELTKGNERGITTFSAAQSSGANLTGTIGYDDTSTFNSENVCAIYGQVIF
ncbi:MAG: hypothetical protein ACTHNP_02860 [Solirubrobacterales bacterium]